MPLTVDRPAASVPDAGVIEEARTRQRRHRVAACVLALAVAGIAAILLASGGGGGRSDSSARARSGSGGSAASRAKQSQEAQQIARVAAHRTIGEERLVAPGIGWAMNGSDFYWTADNGRAWRILEPRILRGYDVIADVGNVAYTAPGHVWLTLNDIQGTRAVNGSTRYATIARTTNGGRSWTESAPPGCRYQCGAMYLSFPNTAHGFVLTASGGGHQVNRLYSTVDGGATWKPVGRAPFVGPVTFTTAQDGWGVSDPVRWVGPERGTPVGAGVPYRTTDGGRSWQRVKLASPHQYAGMPSIADSITFIGSRNGVLPVRYRDRTTGAQHLIVYATDNGGRTWTAHLTPATANLHRDQWAVEGAVAFAAATAKHWLFFAGATLYATADSGGIWRATRSPLAPTHPYDISFTSLTTGWALFPIGNGSGPTSGVALVRTTDGGKTWTALAP